MPEGEIRWVNQRTGTVWINLGRADGLQRQVTFGVYPADITDMSGGGKKASIEVTQILGDHLAEGRIIDDKLTDPITARRQDLYAGVGSRRAAALRPGRLHGCRTATGRATCRRSANLIAMNGGVVDCYIDDKGKQIGEMTINTRYLVLGDRPE